MKRVKALEELVKQGQMDQATFEQQRREMGVGGDIGSTHMVKGLDWELLRRIRAGEDIEGGNETVEGRSPAAEEDGEEGQAQEGEGERQDGATEDAEEEFERVLEERGKEEVSAVTRQKKEKKGIIAPPPPPAAAPQRRSRDEILKQFKASRAGSTSTATATPAAEASGEALGTRFKKIGDSKAEKKRWVEQDETGRRREILQITDPDGKVKRKVKWLDKPKKTNRDAGLLVPDTSAKPLGMEVPDVPASAPAPPPKEEDDDIFEGVGADYDPLAGAADGSSSESEEDGEVADRARPIPRPETVPTEKQKPSEPVKPRNYFNTSATTEPEEPVDRSNPLTKDPTLMAAFKRAANLSQTSPSTEHDDEEPLDDGTSRRSKNFLEEVRRREAQDAMDMDMGFGGSRVGDEEDEEAVPLENERRGGNQRKRGPKKKKGNKDSASDVLRVLDGRKKE